MKDIEQGLPTREGFYFVDHGDGTEWVVEVFRKPLGPGLAYWYTGSSTAESVEDAQAQGVKFTARIPLPSEAP